MDNVAPEVRSRMMGCIPSKDTEPEVVFRTTLFRLGFRYRKHGKGLPGRPDIVLRKYKAAIFVHGCFWHRHPGCLKTTKPRSNAEFWRAKFRANTARDRRVQRKLDEADWRVAVVWACELEPHRIERTIQRVTRWLTTSRRRLSKR